MDKILGATLILCSLVLTAFPQQQRMQGASNEDVKISKDKPTVYLTFERAGERKPLFASESNQGVWLRLHNNTRWAINFCTLSLYIGPKVASLRLSDGRGVLGLRDGVEVNMCHQVEAVKSYESGVTPEGGMFNGKPVKVQPLPVGYGTGDVFSTSWLPAGGSVIFSVPREHLAKLFAVYIPYNYEWEYGERTFRSDEPQHRVYFRASDLPKDAARNAGQRAPMKHPSPRRGKPHYHPTKRDGSKKQDGTHFNYPN